MRKFFLMFFLLILITGCSSGSNTSNDIELQLKYTPDNPELLEYYKEDIHEVREVTTAGSFSIYSVQCDVNDDGNMDYLAMFESPLNTGSGGTALDILVNDGNNVYSNVGGKIVIRINDDTKVYLMNSKDDGFKKIHIIDSEKKIALHYENGYYNLINDFCCSDYIIR